MENAAKALIMAAGVLITLLVIGTVVLVFNRMSDAQAEAQLSKEVEQIVEYNKRFEQFNKKVLYGSDIVSIINRAEDYNRTEASDDVGYTPITLNIIITDEISLVRSEYDSGYRNYIIKRGTHVIGPNGDNKLITTLNAIEDKIESIETYYITKGKPIDALIDLQFQYNNQIASLISVGRGDEANKVQENYKIEMQKYGGKARVENDINLYTTLSSTITNFRAKYFSCTDVIYDATGRVVQMNFKEATVNS